MGYHIALFYYHSDILIVLTSITLVQILTILHRIQTFFITISLQKFALLTNMKGNT
jgi:hypothetical protein